MQPTFLHPLVNLPIYYTKSQDPSSTYYISNFIGSACNLTPLAFEISQKWTSIITAITSAGDICRSTAKKKLFSVIQRQDVVRYYFR